MKTWVKYLLAIAIGTGVALFIQDRIIKKAEVIDLNKDGDFDRFDHKMRTERLKDK